MNYMLNLRLDQGARQYLNWSLILIIRLIKPIQGMIRFSKYIHCCAAVLCSSLLCLPLYDYFFGHYDLLLLMPLIDDLLAAIGFQMLNDCRSHRVLVGLLHHFVLAAFLADDFGQLLNPLPLPYVGPFSRLAGLAQSFYHFGTLVRLGLACLVRDLQPQHPFKLVFEVLEHVILAVFFASGEDAVGLSAFANIIVINILIIASLI